MFVAQCAVRRRYEPDAHKRKADVKGGEGLSMEAELALALEEGGFLDEEDDF